MMSQINPTKEVIKLYAKQLRLPTFANYENIVRQMDSNGGYDNFIVQMMKNELESRGETGQRRRIKKACFPLYKTLDEFDYTRLEHVSQAYIQELSSCDFIKNKENIVMIGSTGSGKTHISIALGLKACYAGFNVKFFSAVNLATTLAEAISQNKLSKLEKSLAKIDLLIIDELSYLTFNRYQSEMLFQIISERSERASIIITTNLAFSEWTELFEKEIMVAALIDRVTFHSHILNMNRDGKNSYRIDQALAFARREVAT